jgi:hypothetical protein
VADFNRRKFGIKIPKSKIKKEERQKKEIIFETGERGEIVDQNLNH